MDHFMKRIQQVHPAVFCSWDLHSNAAVHKAASVCHFWPKKMLQPFITPPVLSRFISAKLFSIPQVENEVKRTPLCRCRWDPRSYNWWIKVGPKRETFGSFSESVRPRKSLYVCQWSLLWIRKKLCVFFMCLRFLKKSVLKLLDCTLYTVHPIKNFMVYSVTYMYQHVYLSSTVQINTVYKDNSKES